MSEALQVAVILPAAGLGTRFQQAGGQGDKLTTLIDGRPVLLRAVELFLGRPEVVQIIIAVASDQVEPMKERFGTQLDFHDVQIVAGGEADRWESVLKAMAYISPLATHVAIHDAARPVTSVNLIDRVFAAAELHDAIVPGLPVSNTLKRISDKTTLEGDPDHADSILGGGETVSIDAWPVIQTVDRRDLMAVQTPQVFERSLLEKAYAPLTQTDHLDVHVTDDASLIEDMGEEVLIVEGESTNVKITRPDDVILCDAIAKLRQTTTTKDAAKALFDDDDD